MKGIGAMEWGIVAQWASLAFSVFAFVFAIWRRRDDDVEEFETQLAKGESRLTKLEADMAHLPSKDSMHELQLTVEGMKGQLAVIAERVAPIKAISERLQESMLEHHR